jgi:cobalt-zinc-cadmium efflux system outer membrane protein
MADTAMRRLRREWRRRSLAGLAGAGLLLGGCITITTSPVAPAPSLALPAGVPRAAVVQAAHIPEVPAQPLTLERLLDQAVHTHPDVAIAKARAEAARGRLIQAGLYPNPTASIRFDELNNPDGRLGMPGSTITQNIVTAHKIPLAKAAAAHGVSAADWQAITQWFNARTRVRLAYYELLTAQRELEVNRGLVRVAEEGLKAARKLLQAGTGTQPDVLRAEVDLEQSRIRVGVSERRVEAAGRLLATAVGLPVPPCEAGGLGLTPLVVGSLDGPVPVLLWQPLLEAVLHRSSEVQEAQALVLQAQKLVERAKAECWPDIQAQLRPFYSVPGKTMEGLVEITAAIPIFNRNQGNIYAARADVARALADVRAAELRLTERLTASYQRYQAARQQVARYEEKILPNAQESLRLVRVGYERGDPKYDYTTVLQAQLTLEQVRLATVGARGELWRGLAEIYGLLQQDELGKDELPPPGIANKAHGGAQGVPELPAPRPASPGPAPQRKGAP